MATVTMFQRGRPFEVEFVDVKDMEGSNPNDKSGLIRISFTGHGDQGSEYTAIFFDDAAVMKAYLRAKADDIGRKQEAWRFNPHNVGFAERAAEADRLAREVSRV